LPVNVELLVDDVIRQGHLGSKSTPSMSQKTPGLGRSLKSASEGQLQIMRSSKSAQKREPQDSHSQVLGQVCILQDDDGEVASKREHRDSHCGTIPEHISILQEDEGEEVASKREHLDPHSETIPEHISILQDNDRERRGGKVTEGGSKMKVQVSSQLSEPSTCHKHPDLGASGGGTYGSRLSLKEMGM